ncbi:MAG TPA: hypothetical protein VMV17_22355 [Streptosporangiaceae bacterium]|nr:hypothetical protein [Streptosporangiaceae bacterium]
MAASAIYLRRVTVPRPPIGRFTSGDVAVMSVMLIVLPAAYVRLPAVAVTAVFGVVFLGAGQAMLAPLTGGRIAAITALGLAAAEIAAKLAGQDVIMLVVNDVFIAIVIIGVVNLWAQTGMTACQVAGIAAVLTVYDLTATWLTSLTQRFLAQVATAPFAPLLAVTGGRHPAGLGLGDCLVLSLWPLVLAKAYGRRAAWAGAVLGVLVMVLIELAFIYHWVSEYRIVPVLTILGPLIIIQYLVMRRWHGKERRTWQWREATVPIHNDTDDVGLLVAKALDVCASTQAGAAGTCLAVINGEIVASAPTPGAARRAARLCGSDAVPVIVRSPAAGQRVR